MRQLTDADALIGKQIKAEAITGNGLVLVFTDDTFLYAVMEDSWGEYYFTLNKDFDPSKEPNAALEAGIISQDEYDKIFQKRQDDNKKREREQYERLKAKFGSTT